MSSILNMLGIQGDGCYNLVIILPIAAIVLVVFVLKFSSGKSNKSNALNVKKQPKIRTNKQNNEKLNSDKNSKGINTSPSTSKNLDSEASDTVNSKTNKNQTNSNEKPPKKNVQTKKQQVNDNNANNSVKNTYTNKQTNNKKQLESFVSKEEEGEWQMVTTKKKKQSTTPSKLDKKHQKTQEKTNKTSKTEKVKVSNETNYIPITVVNGEVTPTEITQVTKSEPSVQGQTKEIPVLSTNSTILHESPIPMPFTSNTLTSIDTAEVNAVTVHSISSANVAFDELGGKLKFYFKFILIHNSQKTNPINHSRQKVWKFAFVINCNTN